MQIFIGGESGVATLDECSVVTAPYEVDGEVVGTVGVIGPTRMAYERVIPIVDITARLLSSALASDAGEREVSGSTAQRMSPVTLTLTRRSACRYAPEPPLHGTPSASASC